MATHSSVLAWSIPGSWEPFGLPSLGSHRAGHDWSNLAAAAAADCSADIPEARQKDNLGDAGSIRMRFQLTGLTGWWWARQGAQILQRESGSLGDQTGGPVSRGSQGRPCPALAISWVTEGIRMRKVTLQAKDSPKGPGQEWVHSGPRTTGTLGWVQVSMCPRMHCWGRFVTVFQLLGKLLSHR